jgi:hypothetical protein
VWESKKGQKDIEDENRLSYLIIYHGLSYNLLLGADDITQSAEFIVFITNKHPLTSFAHPLPGYCCRSFLLGQALT